MYRHRVIARILTTTALAFAIGPNAMADELAALQPRVDASLDAAINGKVAAALMSDRGLLGARIDVDTRNGIVSLDGTVAAEHELRRALEIASRVEGVRQVDNQLQVVPSR